MSNPHLRATWSNVRATCARLGIDLAELAADLDHLDEQARGAAELPAQNPAEVGAALVECGETGADPLEHPAIIRAAVARALTSTWSESSAGSVTAWADERRGDLLTAAAPGLLSALSARVDKAQKVITSARAKGVPAQALASRDYALASALETPAALARDAVKDAEAAVSAWRTLADALNLSRVGVHETAILAADLSARAHDELTREERRTVVAVAVAGHPLSLPATVEEFAARRSRLEAERVAAARAQAVEAQAADRRALSFL